MTYIPPNWNGSVQQSQNYCFPGLIVLCMSPFSHRADVLFQLSRIFGITGRLLHHGQVRRTSLRSRELTFPYPDPRRSLEMLSRACVNGLALPHDEVWPEAIFMGIRFKNFHANQARFSSRASSDSLETGLPAVFVMLSTKIDFGQEASQKCGAERKEDSNGKVWGASSKAPLVVGNGLLQCQGQQRDSYVGRTHVSEEKSSVIALDFYQRASGIKKSRLIFFFFLASAWKSIIHFFLSARSYVCHSFVRWLVEFFFLFARSGLVMIQTTNNVFDSSLYKNVKPQSLLAWHRVRLSNLMAHNGKEWADIYQQYNSGTARHARRHVRVCSRWTWRLVLLWCCRHVQQPVHDSGLEAGGFKEDSAGWSTVGRGANSGVSIFPLQSFDILPNF